jgi:thiol:disulfide interchange protein DsbC
MVRNIFAGQAALVSLVIAGALLAGGAWAQDSAKLEQIKKAVQAKLPPKAGDVDSVTKTPFFGLYEINAGGDLFYTDENVTYLFLGEVVDAKTLQNLTEERRRKLNAIKWDTLPLNKAIKLVRGNGKRKLAVFSDPDCPFCKRFEKQMLSVNDVTIYTFLLPIPSLHPQATEKSKDIWCAQDRAKAWYDFMLNNTAIPNSPECETPLNDIAQIGQKHRINGTPTLVFADGRVVPGAVPASEVEKFLAGVEK